MNIRKTFILAISFIVLFSCGFYKVMAKNHVKQKQTSNRRLKHLFFANGGLRGYFDDGTIRGCPRCDLIELNINSMKRDREVFQTFKEKNNIMTTSDGEVVNFNTVNKERNEWALVNYKCTKWAVIHNRCFQEKKVRKK